MPEIYPWLSATLAQLTAQGPSLPHALLLHGPRGIGKGMLATKLAEHLLCAAPNSAGGCGACTACIWLAAGTHPDFRLLRPESERDDEPAAAASSSPKKPKTKIPIEQIRELVAILSLSAHRMRRVIIIDPAESMTRDAANAVLKTLEEPPADVLFILLSHRPGLLLPTLRSRCRMIAIAAPAADVAQAWLSEQHVDQAPQRLARNGGAPLLALEESANGQDELRTEVLEALAQGAQLRPIALAERIAKTPAADTLRWLQYWVHDLMAQKIAGSCRYNIDRVAQLEALAPRAELSRLLRFQRGLTDAARLIEHPLNMQLYFEQQLIDYSQLFER